MIRMTAPLEVGICCRDLDTLSRFYIDALGCTPINLVEVPADKAAATGLTPAGYRVMRLQTPWGERLKLLEPAAAPAPAEPATPILARQGSIYLTFIVDDIDAAAERLAVAGVGFLSEPRVMEVRPGTWLAFARDPEGNAIELVQYDDIAAYRPEFATQEIVR